MIVFPFMMFLAVTMQWRKYCDHNAFIRSIELVIVLAMKWFSLGSVLDRLILFLSRTTPVIVLANDYTCYCSCFKMFLLLFLLRNVLVIVPAKIYACYCSCLEMLLLLFLLRNRPATLAKISRRLTPHRSQAGKIGGIRIYSP